jgi:tetratricopeptide (TPR) repeat protein
MGLVLALSHHTALADDRASRLQELLYGEALFYSNQKDYVSAISRLELAEGQGMLPSPSKDGEIFLARLKLAYGLDIDAAFDFHALLDGNVSDSVRNRAWYELAKAFFHKGHTEAAEEALGYIRGEVPQDIVGDHQLLQASVLLALNRNAEAAQLLERWRGAPEMAGYAHYNRGIALMRTGDYEGAIASLKTVVDRPAEQETSLALRDKSNLSLAYVYAQMGNLPQAQAQLEKVSLHGPFSNRALQALGWIAYKQGKSEAALVPWTELRGRSPADPAVLETLLVVPTVYRDLDSLQRASQDYEEAIATYSDELYRVDDALKSVRDGTAVKLLLDKEAVSDRSPSSTQQRAPARPHARYLGRLLASRNFQETVQGHNELQSMLGAIDRGLHNVDRLAETVESSGREAGRSTPPSPTSHPLPESSVPAASGDGRRARDASHAGLPPDPEWKVEWEPQGGRQTRQQPRGIPSLPEIELPEGSASRPLPDSDFTGLPESEFTGLPQAPEPIASLLGPEDIGLPDSWIVWLPEPGRLELPWNDEDYAYPDAVAFDESWAGPGARRGRMRLISPGGSDSGSVVAAEPVGEALRDLAAALNSATDRMARLSEAYDAELPADEGLAARIAALRKRIQRLRERINNAIALNESYIQALAVNELNHRQQRLEGLLEKARLELAKTYDKAADN